MLGTTFTACHTAGGNKVHFIAECQETKNAMRNQNTIIIIIIKRRSGINPIPPTVIDRD